MEIFSNGKTNYVVISLRDTNSLSLWQKWTFFGDYKRFRCARSPHEFVLPS